MRNPRFSPIKFWRRLRDAKTLNQFVSNIGSSNPQNKGGKVMPDNPQADRMILSSPPLLADAKSAGRLLGIGRTLFLQLDNSGRLGPMVLKLGKRRLWVVEELRQWCMAGAPRRELWQKMKAEQSEPVLRRARDVI